MKETLLLILVDEPDMGSHNHEAWVMSHHHLCSVDFELIYTGSHQTSEQIQL